MGPRVNTNGDNNKFTKLKNSRCIMLAILMGFPFGFAGATKLLVSGGRDGCLCTCIQISIYTGKG